MMHHIALALCFVFATAVASQACVIPPEEAYQPARALIDRSKAIIVGDVLSVRVTPNTPSKMGERRYRVRVIERLKGDAPAELDVVFSNHFDDTQAKIDERFGKFETWPHDTAAFWVGEEVQGFTYPTCETVFDPRRGRHVIFLGNEIDHTKGFEAIADENDIWYRTVKAMIANSQLMGREVDPATFARLHYAVYRLACASVKDGPCREPLLISGQIADLSGMPDPPGGTFHPDVCLSDASGCAIAWAFFTKRSTADTSGVTLTYEAQPFALQVVNGRLSLPKQRGDLVVTPAEVDERELLRTLGVK